MNEWNIKNNYPLPLISDIVENIGTQKVFTKLNLQWSYNNVQIKKDNVLKFKTVDFNYFTFTFFISHLLFSFFVFLEA